MTVHTLYPGVDPERDHWRGSAEGYAVTLTMFGDYECPFTRSAWRSIELIEEDPGAQFRVVFRHFPLTDFHPRALAAACAVEAAAEQHQFWHMHDLLLGHQDQLEQSDLAAYGRQLGLNLERYEVTRSGRDVAHRIAEDRAGGVKSGVEGTPTAFVDGQRYHGDWELGAFEKAARHQK